MAKGLYAPDGSYRVTIVDGAGGADAPTEGSVEGGTAGTASELVGGKYRATPDTLTDGEQSALSLDTRQNLKVAIVSVNGVDSPAIVAAQGANTVSGSSAVNSLKTVGLNYLHNGSAWFPNSFALTTSRIPSAANSTNATSAKASAGLVKGFNGHNAAAAVRYLKIYNKASAPTVGTDTPVFTFAIPASSSFSFSFGDGLYLATGIAYALTTGAADSDNTAVTAADILGLNVLYA